MSRDLDAECREALEAVEAMMKLLSYLQVALAEKKKEMKRRNGYNN